MLGTRKRKQEGRQGFTLLELLCVIAILSVLAGLFFPSVQSARETARNLSCQNNIRQLSLAAQNFHGVHREFPAGTLGVRGGFVIEANEWDALFDDSEHPYHFRNHQQTSWLVQLLPYVELENLSDQLPSICADADRTFAEYRSANGVTGWMDGIPAVRDVSSQTVSLFLCPSDWLVDVPRIGDGPYHSMTIGTQPLFVRQLDSDAFYAVDLARFDLGTPSPTNYVGCAGAYCGSELPPDLKESLHSMRNYRGVLGSRTSLAVSEIGDGSSHTILAGETLGLVQDGNRYSPSPWFFGGLARGHSALVWEKNYSISLPGLEVIGDDWYSFPVGFGAVHPGTANFGFADGSVRALPRHIDLQVFYSFCGANDGQTISTDR